MQMKLYMVTLEDLVPQGHFLRKLEAALELDFVYEETADLYSCRYGRPPIDPVPVVVVKYLLVGFLYNIPSEWQIEARINDSNALRWYIRYCAVCLRRWSVSVWKRALPADVLWERTRPMSRQTPPAHRKN